MKIDDQGNGGITLKAEDNKPLILIVSRKTEVWNEMIAAISKDKENLKYIQTSLGEDLSKPEYKEILAVKQYQFEGQDYSMLGIDDENSLITEDLPATSEAINLIFSRIVDLEAFRKIILVIHDKELFQKRGTYRTNNLQKLEKKWTGAQFDRTELNPDGDFNDKRQYLICEAFNKCTTHSECEFELWSFMHEDESNIYKKALMSEKNVYDELIKVLIPNYKKKLIGIKFCVLQLFLPFHIDFTGISACDETKRNMYWDKIKRVFFSDNQYEKILNEVCSLIDGNGSDNVEPISSFAADAGFENNERWDELKSLIGKESKADDFFESISKYNLSEKVVNAIENFNFSPYKNGNVQTLTGWADWHVSIVEHFDALIAACK